jgi:ribosomal protein S18 acetylase RimI-like enzyme
MVRLLPEFRNSVLKYVFTSTPESPTLSTMVLGAVGEAMARAVVKQKDVAPPAAIRVRAAEAADLPAIVALDRRITGVAKAGYWQWALEHYAGGPSERTFLIAETDDGALAGFIIGEVRAWEFGAPPAGWVFAVQVDQALRLGGVGTRLFDALCARFRAAGVDRVRTLVDRRDHLILSFFRSQGMTAGPSLQLDLELSQDPT